MGSVTAKQYMDNWLMQINYPNIKIELEDIDSSKNRVKFSQERFLFPDSTAGSSPFG